MDERDRAEKFNVWLNSELDKRGWTRAELARKSGLTTATLSLIANGQRGVGIKAASLIAEAFGVRDIDVMRVAGLADLDYSDYPATIRNTIAMMRDLDESDRGDIESLVRALRERRISHRHKGKGDNHDAEAAG